MVVENEVVWMPLDAIVVVDEGAPLDPPVAAALAATGHRVRVMRNDLGAVAALGSDLPDLAVVDDALAHVAATFAGWGIPVLTVERVLAALDAGVDGVLLAPFGPLEIA